MNGVQLSAPNDLGLRCFLQSMTFWQQILAATGIGAVFPWVALVFIIAALILLYSKPEERMRIRTALLLFGLSVVAFVIAAALLSFGVPHTSLAFKWTRW